MNKKYVKTAIALIVFIFLAIVAFAQSDNNEEINGQESSNTPEVIKNNTLNADGSQKQQKLGSYTASGKVDKIIKSLAFEVECVFINPALEGGHKLTQIEISVDGGDTDSWVATMIAAAKSAEITGSDSIEVTLQNKKIPKNADPLFREIGVTYYVPDGKSSVWADDEAKTKVWEVYASHRKELLGEKDMNISHDYNMAYQKLVSKGMDVDTADEKAGNEIATKYHLESDWELPAGNYDTSTDAVDITSLGVDKSQSMAGLGKLQKRYKHSSSVLHSPCDK